jgi:ABC-type molybdate transport system substrate-binding protein
VEAWGTGPLTYQWFDNGVALSGATNDTLSFTNIQPTNAGLYTVVVTSPLGSVTNTPEEVIVNPAGVTFGGLYPSVLIQGVVGYTYEIQSTANLSDTNSWVTVTNLTLTQPIQLYVDTNTDASLPRNAQRYYRVLPGQ